MIDVTFNELPEAVMMLIEKLDSIEKILLNPKPVPNPESNDFLTVPEAAIFLNLAVPTIKA